LPRCEKNFFPVQASLTAPGASVHMGSTTFLALGSSTVTVHLLPRCPHPYFFLACCALCFNFIILFVYLLIPNGQVLLDL
jgi:hypothetical protein